MLGDSRLLNNLLRTEKDAAKTFGIWSQEASSANSALSAWAAVNDSDDTQDLMDTAIRITQLLSTCTESQRAYLDSIRNYRSSLKELLELEAALRVVLKDREILVGRLIKLGNKKPSDSNFDNHTLKLEDAQRELNGCEAFLQEEKATLAKAKRRIFKQTLANRMKAMAELGKTTEESAREAIELLSRLGQGFEQGYPVEEIGSAAGDSITPSHSASQNTLSNYSSSEEDHEPIINIPAPHQISDSSTLPAFFSSPNLPLPPPIPFQRFEENHVARSRSPSLPSNSTPRVRERTSSSITKNRIPILPAVPIAARGSQSQTSLSRMEIPKAPARVSTRRPIEDSSDEEDEMAYDQQVNKPVQRAPPPSSPKKKFLRRRANSDASTITELRNVKSFDSNNSKKGFFGGLVGLFKKASKEDNSTARKSGNSAQWETRTEKNIFTTSRGAGGGGRRGKDDSSDDDAPKRKLIRVVVKPEDRRAFSEVGRDKSIRGSSIRSGKAMSHVGFTTHTGGGSSLSFDPEPVKKIKKKKSASLYSPTLDPISAAPSIRPSVMSRSNTVTSNFSTATIGSIGTNGLPKKKKKRASTTLNNTMNPSLLRQPLTAADLASSLPSASRSMSYHEISNIRGDHGVLYGQEELTHNGGRIPSHLEEVEKIVKKENLKYGVEGWVQKPSSHSISRSSRRESVATVKDERVVIPISAPVEEGTSRKYGINGDSETSTPVPTTRLPKQRLEAPINGSSSNGNSSLVKRKSVRMADNVDSPAITHHSPSPSVLSNSNEQGSNSSTGRQGILLNSNNKIGNREVTNWNTRNGDELDSSDEDEGEYQKARKAFVKQTKKLETAGILEKGKGKAVDQDE